MRVLIVGLGNPILGDDGVGWVVANEIEDLLAAGEKSRFEACGVSANSSEIEVDYLAVGGLALMERMIGYNHVILIDALSTGQEPPGAIRILPVEHLPNRTLGHLGSAHDMTLTTALKLGNSMGAQLPQKITIVGIEAEINFDFSEELSVPVAAAVPRAAQMVLNLETMKK